MSLLHYTALILSFIIFNSNRQWLQLLSITNAAGHDVISEYFFHSISCDVWAPISSIHKYPPTSTATVADRRPSVLMTSENIHPGSVRLRSSGRAVGNLSSPVDHSRPDDMTWQTTWRWKQDADLAAEAGRLASIHRHPFISHHQWSNYCNAREAAVPQHTGPQIGGGAVPPVDGKHYYKTKWRTCTEPQKWVNCCYWFSLLCIFCSSFILFHRTFLRLLNYGKHKIRIISLHTSRQL